MKIEQVKVELLKPAGYNPRAMTDKERQALTESISRFGMVDPIIVNKHKGRNNIVVGGHQRLEILKALGKETAPVFYVDLTEQDERELNVRLNANAGHWNLGRLSRDKTHLRHVRQRPVCVDETLERFTKLTGIKPVKLNK